MSEPATDELELEEEAEQESKPELEEEPEAEAEPEEEPEEEPEPSSLSSSNVESGLERIARENERHLEHVAAIMGDDYETVAICPLCADFAAGVVFPGRVLEPEQRNRVLVAMGEEPEPELRQNADTETCERCGGMGDLLTGSRTPRSNLMPCPDCGGQGWKQKLAPAAQYPPPPPPTTPIHSSEVYVPPGAPPPPPPVWDYAAGKWVMPE